MNPIIFINQKMEEFAEFIRALVHLEHHIHSMSSFYEAIRVIHNAAVRVMPELRHEPDMLQLTCYDDYHIELVRWQTAGLSSPPNTFSGGSPLGLAVEYHQVKIVAHLLGLGVDPNCRIPHAYFIQPTTYNGAAEIDRLLREARGENN